MVSFQNTVTQQFDIVSSGFNIINPEEFVFNKTAHFMYTLSG